MTVIANPIESLSIGQYFTLDAQDLTYLYQPEGNGTRPLLFGTEVTCVDSMGNDNNDVVMGATSLFCRYVEMNNGDDIIKVIEVLKVN